MRCNIICYSRYLCAIAVLCWSVGSLAARWSVSDNSICNRIKWSEKKFGKNHMPMVENFLSAIGCYYSCYSRYLFVFHYIFQLFFSPFQLPCLSLAHAISILFSNFHGFYYLVFAFKRPALAKLSKFIFHLIVDRKSEAGIYMYMCMDTRSEYAQNWSPLYSALFQFIEFTKNGNVFSILFRDFIPFNFYDILCFLLPFSAYTCIHTYIYVYGVFLYRCPVPILVCFTSKANSQWVPKKSRQPVFVSPPAKKIRTNYVFHACAVNIFISI